MYRKLSQFVIISLLGLLLAGSLGADTVSDAAERIKQRLVQVDEMKASGEVGEDAQGYLAQRSALAGRKAAVVDAENADRKTIYASVAGKTGQSVSEVGAQRALQIAERALSGVWLQKPSGEWYQKP